MQGFHIKSPKLLNWPITWWMESW